MHGTSLSPATLRLVGLTASEVSFAKVSELLAALSGVDVETRQALRCRGQLRRGRRLAVAAGADLRHLDPGAMGDGVGEDEWLGRRQRPVAGAGVVASARVSGARRSCSNRSIGMPSVTPQPRRTRTRRRPAADPAAPPSRKPGSRVSGSMPAASAASRASRSVSSSATSAARSSNSSREGMASRSAHVERARSTPSRSSGTSCSDSPPIPGPRMSTGCTSVDTGAGARGRTSDCRRRCAG